MVHCCWLCSREGDDVKLRSLPGESNDKHVLLCSQCKSKSRLVNAVDPKEDNCAVCNERYASMWKYPGKGVRCANHLENGRSLHLVSPLPWDHKLRCNYEVNCFLSKKFGLLLNSDYTCVDKGAPWGKKRRKGISNSVLLQEILTS